MKACLHDDEGREAQDRLEALLLEGMEGPATPLTTDDWASIRDEAAAYIKDRKKLGAKQN